MPSFRPVDFNSCNPKAICPCDSANPGLIYNLDQPCYQESAWNPSRCSCDDPCCLGYYLQVFFECNAVPGLPASGYYCSGCPCPGCAYPDGFVYNSAQWSTTFLEATTPVLSGVAPAPNEPDYYKRCGNWASYGVNYSYDVITNCSGNPGSTGLTLHGALGYGMRGMIPVGSRVWQAPGPISPNPGCYEGYPAVLVAEDITEFGEDRNTTLPPASPPPYL